MGFQSCNNDWFPNALAVLYNSDVSTCLAQGVVLKSHNDVLIGSIKVNVHACANVVTKMPCCIMKDINLLTLMMNTPRRITTLLLSGGGMGEGSSCVFR